MGGSNEATSEATKGVPPELEPRGLKVTVRAKLIDLLWRLSCSLLLYLFAPAQPLEHTPNREKERGGMTAQEDAATRDKAYLEVSVPRCMKAGESRKDSARDK